MNNFQEVHEGGAWPLEEALRFATGLAEILRKMHRDGTVYGRLDLRNIEWDNHNVTLVSGEPGNESGAYLAPEQVRGEPADARSDIFAFGAIVYQVLSGRRAFPAQEPEELKEQILNFSPPPIEGIPEGLGSLVRGCLEKDAGLRWQRMNSILVELKLAHASVHQALSATEWREKVVSLRSQVTDHEQRLAEHKGWQESMAAEFQQAIQKVEETQAAIHESIAALQKSSQLHDKAIEGLLVAASQTDAVMEHVVEAFGKMHRSVVEHGDKVMGADPEAEPHGLTPENAGSLADRIAAGHLPVREALRYGIAIAEALRAAHTRGRVYATLQPANILIRSDGVQLTPSGAVALTPYFSPEQVQGRELDIRSDIFALGAVMYEMLAGRKAFAAATKVALRFEIMDSEPAPLENVPPLVAETVMRCLEKRPERRVQRMENLLATLKLQEIIARPAAWVSG